MKDEKYIGYRRRLVAELAPGEHVEREARFKGGFELLQDGVFVVTGSRFIIRVGDTVESIMLGAVAGVRATQGWTGGELKLALVDGRRVQFDMVEPKGQAEVVAAFVAQRVATGATA